MPDIREELKDDWIGVTNGDLQLIASVAFIQTDTGLEVHVHPEDGSPVMRFREYSA